MESTATDLDLQSICSSAASTAPPSRTCSPAPSAPASEAPSEAGDDEDALTHFHSTFALTIGSLSVALVEARIEEDSPTLRRQQQLLREFERAMLGTGDEEAGSDDKVSKAQAASQVDKVSGQVFDGVRKQSPKFVSLQVEGQSTEDALRVSLYSPAAFGALAQILMRYRPIFLRSRTRSV